ncbi:MAG TPA: hypothetical protein VLA96_14805 [Terriglobales bacterium]|nr:hypothetical protein [Terriglobales bacterium]
MTRDEQELKALFQAERTADAHSAPAFARVLARPAPADYSYLRALALVAAIVLVAVLASSNILKRKVGTGDSPVPPTVSVAQVGTGDSPVPGPAGSPAPTTRKPPAKAKPVTLSTWKSPTAALLDTPGDDLWTTVPKIGASKYETPKSTE